MIHKGLLAPIVLLLGGAVAAQDKAPEKIGTLDAGDPFRTSPGRTLLFSADGKRLLFCGEDEVRLWDVADGKPVAALAIQGKREYGADVSPDGKTVALGLGSPDGIQLWSVDGPEPKNRLTVKSPGSFLLTLAYSRDGSRILVANGSVIAELAASNLQTISTLNLETDLLALHPDAKTVVAVSTKFTPETILYFDLKTGKPTCCPVRQGEQVASFAVTPDGASLVTVSRSAGEKTRYSIKVWDPKKRKELKTLDAASESGAPVQMSADGKLVGMGGGGFVALWSLKDGTRIWEEATRKIPAKLIALGPGGLLAAWFDGKITLWRFP